MKPVVLINGRVQKEIVPALQERFEVRQWSGEGIMPLDVLAKEIESADALILAYKSVLPGDVIRRGRRLKLIAQHFVGYEDVDVEACTQCRIPFCNTASASSDTVAELAIALMMALSRNILRCDAYVRRGEWAEGRNHGYLYGQDAKGMTMGILGMGRVGYAVAQKAQGLGMNVLYNNRHRRFDVESETLDFADIDDLYARSDIVVSVLPASPDTYHFVDADAFAKMKNTALFINVGRGDTVATEDLIAALQSGAIAQAAIDVVEGEPLAKDHPLLSLPNIIITPHIGASTEQTRLRKSQITIQNVINCFAGKPLIDCVNERSLKNPS